jgi:hypothetical protein
MIATVLTTLLSLTACGSEEPADAGEEGAAPERIELVLEGDEAPETERVPVGVGQPVELVIKSDQPGELHLHSQPEQTLDYASGTTTLTITIDQPGVVDVERHEPEALVLQLEVS